MTSSTVETCTIKPTSKYNRSPSASTITLHGLDLISAPVHISNHRFFHRPEHLKEQDVVDTLKSSLAEALELYPPVAGTVRANEKGELYVALDAEGAAFQVDRRDSPFTGDAEDLSPRPVVFLPTPSSALAVKVTQFSCGTVAVASSLHHYISDLRGFLDFLEVWSKIARGKSIDLQAIPEDWAHTPGRFFAEDGNSLKAETSPPAAPKGYQVMPSVSTEMPVITPAAVLKWRISASALANLKKDLTDALTESSDAWISTGDALTALLWSVITRARESAKIPRTQGFGRSSVESGTETVAMAADGRERAPNKNMSGGRYLGNFNLLFMTTVSRDDLMSSDAKSTSRVALAIRSSLNEQLSPEAIKNRIRYMEAPENTQPPGRIFWTADVVFTNWCMFDLLGEDMDFGWGTPFEATGGEGVLPAGYVCLLQNKSTGDVTVISTVEKEGLHAMQTDALMNKYATLVKIR
ncbi:hypothetical protein K493DRAFT_362931 [Basidiobolus meristosporus CBS 931.73]|uniref:Transferase n=1 Tax=Basidiobolus meristosporus CBS 931.73 TaxID=1314790 RepID=A0A1Y1WZ54_9FUNG|nr:hypothetical protein K493DRAFT_362931 [Basidiobolus meristosporus CBS 931.73]|eukprot:ORX78466.1 hypothetical protein K493DRAFT_362931 [Basidiobolus meristosporus CBS 931.73]